MYDHLDICLRRQLCTFVEECAFVCVYVFRYIIYLSVMSHLCLKGESPSVWWDFYFFIQTPICYFYSSLFSREILGGTVSSPKIWHLPSIFGKQKLISDIFVLSCRHSSDVFLAKKKSSTILLSPHLSLQHLHSQTIIWGCFLCTIFCIECK